MLFELSEGALRFLVPLNLDSRGITPDHIGVIIFAFSLTSLLSRGVAAALFRPDRARLLIVGAGLASTIAYLLTPFTNDVAVFATLMAFDGFGWGMATTCLLAMLMLCTPEDMSPAVSMGWYIGFQGIAFAIATALGGFLGEIAGIQPAMLILATVPVLAAALIGLRLPPIVRTAERPTSDAVGAVQRFTAAIRQIGLLPFAVWAAALVAVYLNVINGLLASFFPLLGISLGLSIAQIGTLSSVRSGVSAVARFGAGWIFARVSPRRLHWPLLAMSTVTLALLPSVEAFLVALPLFALTGVSRGLLRVTTSATAMEQTKGHQAGMSAAVMTAGLDVGKMVGPLIGGFVAAAAGLPTMFRVVPFGFLVAYGVLYAIAARARGSIAASPGPGPTGTTPELAS